jgi:hypothetical protein
MALEASGVRTVIGVEPNTIRPPFCRISEIPRVTTSWPKWPSSSDPLVRRPDTRAIRNLCSSAPPAKTTGPASKAPTNGPMDGPRKARTPPPVTMYRLANIPSISSSPWAKLTMRMTPKIRPRPMHISP